jgi:hypothetical protein
MLNSPLTLPLKLKLDANPIFQSFRYLFTESAGGARRKKACAILADGETGTWSRLRIQAWLIAHPPRMPPVRAGKREPRCAMATD